MNRPDAIAAGVKRYSSGKPCPRGHTAERFCSSRRCVACVAADRARWDVANSEKRRLGRRAGMRTYRAANLTLIRKKCREYSARARREDPERIRDTAARWARNNRGKKNASWAARTAAKLQRTPRWADKKKIEQIYEEARQMTLMMGEPWHVDHVVPLRGKKVSGLHVHTNLQLLPGRENFCKSNCFEEA